ncbi:MAG TPA: AAA family ATPase, partial [Asanoa sp.]|nr:AAA family ATPase [Asanoa sp.]
IGQLAELRRAQGHLETLRELRYVDLARIDSLGAELSDQLDGAARRAVEFLKRDDAFAGYHADVERLTTEGAEVPTVAAAAPVGERLTEQGDALRLVTDVVGSLDIADATVRTAILERIGEVLGAVNRARATLDARRRELAAVEGRAGFAAEFALLNQAVTGALAAAGTPEACDDQLGRLLLQVENLESRYGEFDDFLTELTTKRTDVYEAFAARKQVLVDARSRRADRLVDSADRILTSVRRRASTMDSLDDVNTYFAADPMVAKLRSVADELRALGDAVRGEELDGRVKSARQEAGRALRDRIDLFSDGGETIQLGRHKFAVNTQAIELALVPHDGAMAVAVTGTEFREPVDDPEFATTAQFWDQPLVSESPAVSRAEFLATSILATADLDALHAAAAGGTLGELVRRAAEERIDEGYERGIHDADATAILDALLRLHAAAGLLRYPPAARAAAQLFWAYGAPETAKPPWTRRATSLARARAVFGGSPAIQDLQAELEAAITAQQLIDHPLAGEYLFEELAAGSTGFVTSAGAKALVAGFRKALGRPRAREFDDDLRALGTDLTARHQLVEAWLTAYAPDNPDLTEAVAIELCGTDLPRYDSAAELTATVEGLLGTHRRIAERRLTLRLDEALARTREFRDLRVPAYRGYQKLRAAVTARAGERLRLDEHKPRVMSGFVRNRLLDEVYLPLIADNLARQVGAAGDAKRVDQSGLLLLISPPGYGKTTLMEYVASRLGLVFVKVNGPALGTDVTSVDPAAAPNATARQEVEKISFALEMGSNVLLYLDDIQHTSPELLQKFISLCDAQRRMEGVWDGRTRTYDLRGKRFAVCMAGNPYTESGKRFRVPDMLANRADVWNLGDVLSGREELFALSYVENSLTTNPVLAPLSTRERGDVELLVRMARGDTSVLPDQLAHPYPPVELTQIRSVLTKLLRVQDVVLAVNRAYIASAGQDDAARTEPPFLLQGSYRNMNKLAERILPVMNDEELEAVLDDHYLGEAQTLAAAAEANLLKLASLRDRLTPAQAARWEAVKAAYLREKALGGSGDDPMTRAVGAIGLVADRIGAVEAALKRD